MSRPTATARDAIARSVVGASSADAIGTQPLREFVRSHRAADMKALRLGASHLVEPLVEVEALHAYGHHFEAEVATEVDDRSHDGLCAIVAGAHLSDEAPVDLDAMDRQRLEE